LSGRQAGKQVVQKRPASHGSQCLGQDWNDVSQPRSQTTTKNDCLQKRAGALLGRLFWLIKLHIFCCDCCSRRPER
jgi:hypothetical protein